MDSLPPLAVPPAQPPVIRWFKVYAGIMACLYIGLILLGISMVVAQFIFPRLFSADEILALLLSGCLLIVCCIVFAAVFLLPFFLQPKPWMWIYNLVLICLGFGSLCTLPFCIWMLIYWLKPEVKTYYGRT